MRAVFALCLAIFAAPLLGCVSAVPKADAMTARELDRIRSHPARIGVQVQGGGGLEYRISDEAFHAALTRSLLEAGLFSGLVEIDAAEYRLDAVLGDLRQQPGGFNMTSEMSVLWNLSRVDTGETVWQELIQTTYTATVGAAFAAVNRARISTEGVARENIAEAIRRLSAADLQAPPSGAR